MGYWLVRIFRGEDIRTQGSGNVGATNVWRVYGPRLGLPVALLDVAKGFVPAFVGDASSSGTAAACSRARRRCSGTARPIFLGFQKGGKMVATAGGAFLGVAPLVGAAGAGVWILVFALTRYASVASIVGRGLARRSGRGCSASRGR